jgi:SAM-dependent methyltransferase
MTMEGDRYTDATYGERWAEIYDSWHLPPGFEREPDSAVALLRGLAQDGAALELGIGTGRVALPLAEAGVEVHGLDVSEPMVAKLRAKPGGDLPVTMSSMADFELGRRFRLIYVVFNTIWAVRTPDGQASCIRAVARHLEPGGAFVVEAFVPDPTRYDRGQRVGARQVESDLVVLEASLVDPDDPQQVSSTVVLLRAGEPVELYPVRIRYATIAELDRWAREAGLELAERWSDWDREPFDDRSVKHVSVWRAPG